MRGEINITHRLYRLERAVQDGFAQLFQRLESMMYVSVEDFAALKSAVERNTSETHSVVMVLQSYASKFSQNADDAQAVRALAQELQSSADELASAVVAGTPSDPANTGTVANSGTLTAQQMPGGTTQQATDQTGTGTAAGVAIGDGTAPGTTGTLSQNGTVGEGGAIASQGSVDQTGSVNNGGTVG